MESYFIFDMESNCNFVKKMCKYLFNSVIEVFLQENFCIFSNYWYIYFVHFLGHIVIWSQVVKLYFTGKNLHVNWQILTYSIFSFSHSLVYKYFGFLWYIQLLVLSSRWAFDKIFVFKLRASLQNLDKQTTSFCRHN